MPRHANLNYILTLITYEELFGPVPSDAQALVILARLPKRFTIKALSALVILTNRMIRTQAVQLKLLSMVTKGAPNPTAARIRELVSADERRVFFNEEQITVAIALLCKHGKDSDDEHLDLTDFFQMLVFVNSLIGDAAREAVGPATSKESRFAHLLIGEVRSLFGGTVNFIDVVWRYREFIEWSPSARAPQLPHSLAEEFQTAIGIPYGEYATAMMAVSAHAMAIVSSIPDELSLLVLNRDQWLSSLPIKSGVEFFIDLNSTAIGTAAAAIGDGTLTSQAVNWRKAFLRAPLLDIGAGEYCYTFLPALPESLGRAFFSRLLDHYNAAYGEKTGNAFLDYYGRFFEDYVCRLLSRSIRKPVVGDDEAFATKDSTDNRIIDAVVVEVPDLTFVEVTAKRFNLTKTVISGGIESLNEDLHQMVVAKAVQLQRSIDMFLAGQLPMVPANPSDVKRCHPVLVLQEFPQYAAVRRRAMQFVSDAGVSLPSLQFVTIDELEMIETSLRRGYRLGDIIKKKCRRADEVEMSLRNYLIKRQPTLIRGKPADLRAEQGAWFEQRMTQLQKWGFETQALQVPTDEE